MTGTLTLTSFPFRDKMMDRLVREVQYTGPASYATGGDPISGSDLGSGEIFGVYGNISDGSSVRTAWWDYANQKLKFFVPNTNVEVAAAVNLSTFSGTLLFTCKG
jgi:hypothetical protein